MNRTEYMNALEKRLRILPGASYREAMAYFQEYFDEAGPEREQQAIEDLGSPENAAEQIITNMAIDKTSVPHKGIRKNMNALWIGILAICAVPVALPSPCCFWRLCAVPVVHTSHAGCICFTRAVCGSPWPGDLRRRLYSAPICTRSCNDLLWHGPFLYGIWADSCIWHSSGM